MTCIVGIRHEAGVTIGGDSVAADGYDLQLRADDKVFSRVDENGLEWVFGFSGSFRMGQLLRYKLELPEVPFREERALEFMATRFADAVRTCFKDGGFLSKDAEREFGGDFLIGVRGLLFYADPDFHFGTPVDRYAAIGAGAQAALGALYITRTCETRPETQGPQVHAEIAADLALRAAERHCIAVRHPWKIITGAPPAIVEVRV